jgi:hypothetical protein
MAGSSWALVDLPVCIRLEPGVVGLLARQEMQPSWRRSWATIWKSGTSLLGAGAMEKGRWTEVYLKRDETWLMIGVRGGPKQGD